MKTILITILIGTLLTLSSCKKEDPTYCWECAEAGVTYYDDDTFDIEVFDIDTHCGVTEDEISLYEKETWYSDYYLEMTTCYKINK